MSGANNIPLGARSGGGSLAAAASTLGGVSLLNPAYLGDDAPPPPRRSKFGPPVEAIGPPMVVDPMDEPVRKKPNMDLINSINSKIGKMESASSAGNNVQPEKESREERRRKRKSRWGGQETTEKTFIPGMPTMMPQGLSKDQEEAYLLQLKIEDASRRLRTGDLGIPLNPEERSPSPEPIYSSDGKRLNTREYRKRKEMEETRHNSIQRMMAINAEYKPPPDYKPPMIKVNDKVMIPQEEHPEINFVGLLIGPRGNTLKSMESETGAKIIIRGKGSVKEGKVGRKDGQPLPGEDEPLHAYVTSTNPESVKKAVEKIKHIIKEAVDVPEGQNDLRRHQLRELALLNGTLREGEGPRCTNCGAGDHKSWQCQDKPNVTNNVVCSSCGGTGHISKDCMGKKGNWNEGPKSAMDEEYMSLMAELGEGPPPPNPKEDKQAWRNNTSGGGSRMFGGPPRPPRPLMGGPRSAPPPPPGEYGDNSWGGPAPPPPPGTSGKHSSGHHGGGHGGHGWNMPPPPPPGMGAPPPPGQWGGHGGGSYGMPPPGYGVPPPPPGSGPPGPPGTNGSANQWSSWPPPPGTSSGGPGPVPPPPRSFAPPPPGAPPGMPPSWPPPPGWTPPTSSSGSGILSNLIGAPPPPPPPS